jgi:glyoxylase-like metal-dependent hydrolase (beta-lactamase superfamily II)
MPEFTVSAFEVVADGVWRAVAEPEGVSIGLVAGTDAALVIDTGSSPEQGAAILASARATAGVDVRHVVVTHAHYDHWFGLAAFDGIESLGHEALAEALNAPDTLAQAERLGVSPAEIVLPVVTFSLVAARDLGGRRVEIVHLGHAHTPSDVAVVVQDALVVFTGDLVEVPGPPSFGPESSPGGWAQALDSLISLVGPRGTIVPGHGDPVRRAVAEDQWSRIGALNSLAVQLCDRGVGVEEAIARGGWPYPDEVIRAALPGAYAERTKKRPARPSRQLSLYVK